MAIVKPIKVTIIINEREAFDLFQLLEISEYKLRKAGLPHKNLSLYEELGRTFNLNGMLPVGMPVSIHAPAKGATGVTQNYHCQRTGKK